MRRSAESDTSLATSQLNTLIHTVQGGLTKLINEILRNDLATAQTQYNSLSPSFDKILHLASPKGSCPTPPAGHALTQQEAIQIIQTIQYTLNLVSLDVTNGDSASALSDACTALADYFNSGLHEYIFGH